VRDAAAFERWARAYNDGFGLPDGFVDALGGVYARIGFADDAPFRHYAGLLHGEAVACSTMFLDGKVAGLWHITTLERARRRGIGAAMTIAPLADARGLGYSTAILYASEMGEPLYQRLGFRELLRLYQYGWQFDELPPS
jgi:GNAT superfamily N-acetyltransferase